MTTPLSPWGAAVLEAGVEGSRRNGSVALVSSTHAGDVQGKAASVVEKAAGNYFSTQKLLPLKGCKEGLPDSSLSPISGVGADSSAIGPLSMRSSREPVLEEVNTQLAMGLRSPAPGFNQVNDELGIFSDNL